VVMMNAADVALLRPPAELYLELGAATSHQVDLLRGIRTDLNVRETALANCEALRQDATAPESFRSWATIALVYLRNLSGMPLPDTLAIAEAWLDAQPEESAISLRLRSYLASAYTHQAGIPRDEKKRVVERLMLPLFDTPYYAVDTVHAGILYAQLLRQCHNGIMNDWVAANITNYPPEERHVVQQERIVQHRRIEHARLRQVDEILKTMEEQPWLLPDYNYFPDRTMTFLSSARLQLNISLTASQRVVTGASARLQASVE